MTIDSTSVLSHPAPLARRVAGLAALSAFVMFSLQSQAQAPAAAPAAGAAPMEHPQRGWGGGHGPRGPGMGMPMDGAGMEKMAERRISMMVKVADGTPEQKAKLLAIAKAAQADLAPLRAQRMQSRRKGMELLAAPTIDRAALEQLRVAQLQVHDAMGKRMLQAMADSAEVFTPVQRAKLAERMKQRMERGHTDKK